MEKLISKAALSLYKEINTNKKIFSRFKGINENRKIMELESDLALFLLENKQKLSKKLSNLPNKEFYLKKAFINHLKDKERTKDNSFFLYLRKKIIDDFKKSKEIISKNYDSFIYFSISKSPTVFLNSNTIDFNDVFYPENDEFRIENQIVKQKNLKNLFFHFMNEVEKYGYKKNKTAVNVNDFNAWIFSNNMFENSWVSIDDKNSFIEIHDKNLPDIYDDSELIANQILSEFNEKEQKALSCYLFQTKKADVSRELGYSSQSALTALIKKTLKKLQSIFHKNNFNPNEAEDIINSIKNILDKN
ncbi:MAG: hypothetical protein RBR53_06050 [Desulforegulaceae bacterium]|nr:hypothetical protein [Desulforegulaceae bacterium]